MYAFTSTEIIGGLALCWLSGWLVGFSWRYFSDFINQVKRAA